MTAAVSARASGEGLPEEREQSSCDHGGADFVCNLLAIFTVADDDTTLELQHTSVALPN